MWQRGARDHPAVAAGAGGSGDRMMKSPERQIGGDTQGLGQFQLEGDAAERYERWTVPFLLGPWVPGLLDLARIASR